MVGKIRVVWLCTYADAAKYRHVRRWRNCEQRERGPWIPNFTKGFEGDGDFEIHVVSLEYWLKRNRYDWTQNGIYYHALPASLPIVSSNLHIHIDGLTDFAWNRHALRKIIREIAPDVINVYGFENPQYASVLFDLDDSIPVVCTVQGFVSRELAVADTKFNRLRTVYEIKLMNWIKNFLGDRDSEKVVRVFNPRCRYDYIYFPVNEGLVAATPKQEIAYDILFAGAPTVAKGLPDFVKVVAQCAKENPGFKAAIVASPDACSPARDLEREFGLQANITWTGRFPTQAALFETYRKSKLFLTPTYNDAFASTIRENMLLGTPCISYATGGIPYANDDGNENVVIVPQGDVDAMASKVLYYLAHEDERQALAARAKVYAEKTFSLAANADVIKAAYRNLAKKKETT